MTVLSGFKNRRSDKKLTYYSFIHRQQGIDEKDTGQGNSGKFRAGELGRKGRDN